MARLKNRMLGMEEAQEPDEAWGARARNGEFEGLGAERKGLWPAAIWLRCDFSRALDVNLYPIRSAEEIILPGTARSLGAKGDGLGGPLGQMRLWQDELIHWGAKAALRWQESHPQEGAPRALLLGADSLRLIKKEAKRQGAGAMIVLPLFCAIEMDQGAARLKEKDARERAKGFLLNMSGALSESKKLRALGWEPARHLGHESISRSGSAMEVPAVRLLGVLGEVNWANWAQKTKSWSEERSMKDALAPGSGEKRAKTRSL